MKYLIYNSQFADNIIKLASVNHPTKLIQLIKNDNIIYFDVYNELVFVYTDKEIVHKIELVGHLEYCWTRYKIIENVLYPVTVLKSYIRVNEFADIRVVPKSFLEYKYDDIFDTRPEISIIDMCRSFDKILMSLFIGSVGEEYKDIYIEYPELNKYSIYNGKLKEEKWL